MAAAPYEAPDEPEETPGPSYYGQLDENGQPVNPSVRSDILRALGTVPGYAPTAPSQPNTAPVPAALPKADKVTGPDPFGERQAQADLDQEVANSETAEGQEGIAKNAAARGTANARAGAMEQTANDIQGENEDYFKAREQANRDADSETARWMADLDAKSKEEPSPHRWWDNTSGFGKALYLLSLGFSAMAQAKDPTGKTKNVVSEMIEREINEDVARQKDRLTKEISALKEKGQVMTARQARDAQFMTDEHAAKVAHWTALGQALDMKAQAPGDQDDAAALAQAKAHVEAKRVELAGQHRELVARSKEAALNRSAENMRHAQDIKKDYDLAGIAAAAKIKEAEAKAKGESLPLPIQSGASLVGPGGDVQQITLPKGAEGDKAAAYARESTQEYNRGQNLVDKLGQASSWDLITKKDPQLQSAIYDFLVPTELKEGGKREVTMAGAQSRVMQQYLGADPNGWLNAVRDIGPQDLKAVLQERLAEIGGDTQGNLSGVAGTNLADLEGQGYRVTFNPPNTRPPPAKKVGAAEFASDVTGETHELPRPMSATEVHRYEDAGEEVHALPPELDQILTKARAGAFHASDTDAQKAVTRARAAVEAWTQNQQDLWGPNKVRPGHPEDQAPRVEAGLAAKQAQAVLDTLQERVTGRPGEAELADKIARAHVTLHQGDTDRAEVKAQAEKRGLKLTSEELTRLVDQVNERIHKGD